MPFEIIKVYGPIQSLLFTTNNHSSCHYFKYDLAMWILVHYFQASENCVGVPPEMDFLASACNYPEHFLETEEKKSKLAWSSEPSSDQEEAQRSLLTVRRVDYYIALLICSGYAFIHVCLALPFQH